MPIIQVDHLTKEYRLGAMQGLKQTLLNTAARLTGKKVEERPLFKALDDVSFSIEPGEVVGIIGHNGAGKSTLLKMRARISTPTSGSVRVDGRIAPLIEVGAGFVPDFTGRENVYLNGAILGMSRQEIDRKFDEIVDFAEMAEFIDIPVKRYSSGIQAPGGTGEPGPISAIFSSPFSLFSDLGQNIQAYPKPIPRSPKDEPHN